MKRLLAVTALAVTLVLGTGLTQVDQKTADATIRFYSGRSYSPYYGGYSRGYSNSYYGNRYYGNSYYGNPYGGRNYGRSYYGSPYGRSYYGNSYYNRGYRGGYGFSSPSFGFYIR